MISIRELVAARIGYLASLPHLTDVNEIENVKSHALFLGMSEAGFEEFLPEILSKILKDDMRFLEELKKNQ